MYSIIYNYNSCIILDMEILIHVISFIICLYYISWMKYILVLATGFPLEDVSKGFLYEIT